MGFSMLLVSFFFREFFFACRRFTCQPATLLTPAREVLPCFALLSCLLSFPSRRALRHSFDTTRACIALVIAVRAVTFSALGSTPVCGHVSTSQDT
eukprot:m.254966 g.254966  ORF g.254966 m.254966 type:complete len:96 (-) comp19152_c2_seq5:1141-1428(-)